MESAMGLNRQMVMNVLWYSVSQHVRAHGVSKEVELGDLERWEGGPVVEGVEPIVVEFKKPLEREAAWNVLKNSCKDKRWFVTKVWFLDCM